MVRREFLKNLILVFSVLMAGWCQQAYAAPPEAAREFVSRMAERTLGIIADEKLTQEQKKADFRKMLQNHFDMDTISRFALGRYWNVATPEQRKEYRKLLNVTIIDVYTDRFDNYQGEKFEVAAARPEAGGDVLVTSYILPQDKPKVKVDWRVREKDGKFRIVDVIVQDVSMVVTKRSDFASVIQRGGGDVQVLLDYLKSSKNI